ncbi:MAG: aspartate--tRNA ligase [Candidatus Eremiobacteraeota bacterium]|nr:aspartate--tRNA ligase [Candidatus Eremiobacteraeota bacterium]
MNKRSCGDVRANDSGAKVELSGWVNRRRDHGGLIFIDIRDHTGVTQVVFHPGTAAFTSAESLRHEDVVRVRGTVERRPAGTENAKLSTGEIEVVADDLLIYSRALVPPFPIWSDDEIDESLRLQYRYLDLRRPHMQRNMRLRHRIVKATRDFFDSEGFIEVETPMLIKSTPEGARDYLVPSRLHHGSFYALPQSPQILKQLLMVGGFGKYLQIARCMRDEDLRADRQPEFTQIDVEMSFVTEDDVFNVMERCMVHIWRDALGVELRLPFPRFTHADVLRRYGSDKPDLRFDLELNDVSAAFANSEFKLFRDQVSSADGVVIALRYPGGAALSRRDFDALTEDAKRQGARGLVWAALDEGQLRSPVAKFLNDETMSAVNEAVAAAKGDAVLLLAGERTSTLEVAGRMRNIVGERCGLRNAAEFRFAWVTDFPLFEVDAQTGKPMPAHHPFTAPRDDQWGLLESDPLAMRAQHYDLVLNGWELGSGSIRIHKPEFQKKIFSMLGMTPQQIEDQFGFFLRALDYGAPPHGGIALGIDRIAMIAAGEEDLREVTAFPKNQAARDMMMETPSPVRTEMLKELGIALSRPKAP